MRCMIKRHASFRHDAGKKNQILVRLNILKITFSQTTFIQSDTVRSSNFFF